MGSISVFSRLDIAPRLDEEVFGGKRRSVKETVNPDVSLLCVMRQLRRGVVLCLGPGVSTKESSSTIIGKGTLAGGGGFSEGRVFFRATGS